MHVHWEGCPLSPRRADELAPGDLIVHGHDVRRVNSVTETRLGELRLSTTRYRGRHASTLGTFTDSHWDVVTCDRGIRTAS